MKILVLSESLDVNRTSSGICSSNFLNALANQNEISCLHAETAYEDFPWLKNIETIPLKQTTLKDGIAGKMVKMIPKMRGLLTHLNGYHVSFNHFLLTFLLFSRNEWTGE